MKYIAVFLMIVLTTFTCHAQSTLTIVTNPVAGGTVTGAGTYADNTDVYVDVESAYGYYISNITFPDGGSPIQFNVDRALLGGGDLTTITSITFDQPLSSNLTVTVDFGPLSPVFNPTPTDAIVVTGGTATFTGAAGGRQPMSYQWQFNGANIAGATKSTLSLTNVQAANAGSYTLTASNGYGTSNSPAAELTVKDFVISTNDQPVGSGTATVMGGIFISMQSLFPNGSIFYTLDGSTPDFSSTHYGGEFYVTSTADLRAIAYSADFSQSVYADPVHITVVPEYDLYPFTWGGGTITVDPPFGVYGSNSVVSVVATPNPGWTFMGWMGDLSGNNPTNVVVMTGGKSVDAMFGTTLATTTAGNGTVSVSPAFPLHPYGTIIELTAIPALGSYFATWGNAASVNANPLSYYVSTPNATLSALFAPLPTNQVSLTVISDGAGYVDESLTTNKYIVGSTNLLFAHSDYGEQFLNWSGSVTGSQNPLSITLNSNMVITAHFNRIPLVGVSKAGTGIVFSVQGVGGTIYEIETSTNFTAWTELFSATSYIGETLTFSNQVDTTLPYRLFRAVPMQ